MRQCKTFSIIPSPEVAEWLNTGLAKQFIRGQNYLDTRFYLRFTLSKVYRNDKLVPIIQCDHSTKQQRPLLDLDHVKALTLLPPEAWHEYLKHLKKEYYDGNKGTKDRPST